MQAATATAARTKERAGEREIRATGPPTIVITPVRRRAKGREAEAEERSQKCCGLGRGGGTTCGGASNTAAEVANPVPRPTGVLSLGLT